MSDRYLKIFENMQGGSVEDQNKAGFLEEGYDQSPSFMPKPQQSQQVDAGPNDTQKVGQGAMTAGAATGNPYLIAGGYAAKTFGDAKAADLAREQAKVDSEMGKRERVMALMGQLAGRTS